MNKRYILVFSFLIILVLLSSCAQKPAATGTGRQAASEEKPEVQDNAREKYGVAPEVKELLEKSAKVKSAYYKYRGPETGSNFHEFYIKGGRIKYKPHLEIKTLDKPESYDTIFIDKSAKTAASYCEAAYCAYKGKKQDLDYNTAYLQTIFDWMDVTQAAKIGEEVIESRSTWKIETNKGIIWVDAFYGVPLKAESNGKTYRFEQLAPNIVQDSDVVPGS